MIMDTNALSAFMEADPGLLPVLHAYPNIHLTVIVLGEYRFGALGSRISGMRLWLANTSLPSSAGMGISTS